jgi:hypothetical protein
MSWLKCDVCESRYDTRFNIGCPQCAADLEITTTGDPKKLPGRKEEHASGLTVSMIAALLILKWCGVLVAVALTVRALRWAVE